jgi:hypothetical protein
MPSNAVMAYVIAYVVVLLSCVRIWFADPTMLYIGRDADFSVWLAGAYLEWAHPFGVTALNPFQGMGSMLMPMNPYFNPGAWVFQMDLGLVTKFVLSMVVYFLEVTVSCFVLGRALGFSQSFSFAAALWLVILLFPPFNFVFGLQGWLATSPQWGHTLAMSNLILTLFLLIGKRAWSERGLVRACAINGALATGMLVLLLLCLLAAPFYSAATMSGTILLCAVILLSSSNRGQAFWRIGAGLYVLAICQALGMFEFFVAAKSVTARFTGHGNSEVFFPQVHWPIEFSHATLAAASEWLCAAGVACSRLPARGALTGSYWLHVAIIVGGIAVWSRMPRPLSRVGSWFALLWASLLVFWLLCSFGIVSDVVFSPVYFLVTMLPFLAFFSLFSLWLVVRFLALRVMAFAPRVVAVRGTWASPLALPIAIMACASAMAWGYGALLARKAPAVSYFVERGAFDVRKSGSIVDRLRHEIALHPGERFRGSVATILGAKGGSLRKALGLPDTTPLAPGQYEDFLNKVRAATGNDHDLFDLWWFDIPTLSEYAQGISRQFMFYVTNFLSDSGDPRDVGFAFPRVANIDVLRAMGVRFVIIDRALSDSRVALLVEESVGGAELYLYEITNPNLGTYSPVEVEVDSGLGKLRASVERNPAILASRAFVQSPIEGSLVPARNARMIFEKNSVRVVASTNGTSILLLPLQFSHCLRVSDPGVRVSRADLIFTLIQFDGPLDARLSWVFNFWRNSGCRMEDRADLRRLGLIR